jgi:hypothetical protein
VFRHQRGDGAVKRRLVRLDGERQRWSPSSALRHAAEGVDGGKGEYDQGRSDDGQQSPYLESKMQSSARHVSA